MSVTNPEISLKSIVRKNEKDYFTLPQAALLILLTIVITTTGWYLAGKYYFWTGLDMKRVNAQLEFLQKKVDTEPKNLENRIALGYTYFLKSDNDKAIKEFNQALAIDKKYQPAYYNLGLVYSEEDRLDDAMEMFQKALELSPKDYKSFIQKGIVYRKLKMYKEAVETLEKANKLMPGSANIIYEIGRVAEDQGNIDTAITIYKEALSYDPLYKEALKALERVEQKR